MIKNIVFTNCWFESTNMIKKVIIDSGLANMLDKVTFNGFKYGTCFDEEFKVIKKNVKKMVEKYKNATGNNNLEVK